MPALRTRGGHAGHIDALPLEKRTVVVAPTDADSLAHLEQSRAAQAAEADVARCDERTSDPRNPVAVTEAKAALGIPADARAIERAQRVPLERSVVPVRVVDGGDVPGQ